MKSNTRLESTLFLIASGSCLLELLLPSQLFVATTEEIYLHVWLLGAVSAFRSCGCRALCLPYGRGRAGYDLTSGPSVFFI